MQNNIQKNPPNIGSESVYEKNIEKRCYFDCNNEINCLRTAVCAFDTENVTTPRTVVRMVRNVHTLSINSVTNFFIFISILPISLFESL